MTNIPLKLEYHNFCEVFKPQKNHIDDNASFDGCMFETYGVELEHIKAQPQEHIWTILDCDGSLMIANGWHYVNRIGYIVTENPIPEGVEFEVPEEKEKIIITAQHVLDVAAYILPDMDDGEAEEFLSKMHDEILFEADNTFCFWLKELKWDLENEQKS